MSSWLKQMKNCMKNFSSVMLQNRRQLKLARDKQRMIQLKLAQNIWSHNCKFPKNLRNCILRQCQFQTPYTLHITFSYKTQWIILDDFISEMFSKDITLDSAICIMMECFDRFQNDGDKEGILYTICLLDPISLQFSLEWDASPQSCSCSESNWVWWLNRLLQDSSSICWKVGLVYSL